MTKPQPNAIAIARKISGRKPVTGCALGLGHHEVNVERDAALLETFCAHLGIDMDLARHAIETGLPLSNLSSIDEDAYV
jgi:hypothetical protein